MNINYLGRIKRKRIKNEKYQKMTDDMLADDHERLNYDNLIKKYPWILEENQKCILSPDSDGLLCGLFMSNVLNWSIVGFYDGKVLMLKK